jgi:large subunit ribosomal protein L6
MSRIGKLPISLPAGVEVKISDSNLVTVKGPKGELQEQIGRLVKVEINDGVLTVTRDSDSKDAKSAHGLSRTLINNMVVGVTTGFEKKLQLVGVGYKSEKRENVLVLNLGYSHPIVMKDPEGILTTVTTPTEILVQGNSKQLVGNHAANIRKQRPPEPYKGKGVKYVDEVILRKEGKTGKK